MNKTVKIIIAAHKKYDMPNDAMYIPLHVGAEGKEDLGYTKDNTGDNISELNPVYCELTGLYWAWKNLDADYIGLVHYRRHFSNSNHNILTYQDIEPYLDSIKVFVPKKRKYYIETLYSHYAHTHYESHLIETRNILNTYHPEYVSSFDKTMKQTYGYMFNMMIMDKILLNEYCEWMFDVVFKLDKVVDISDLDPFQQRYVGRVSELLFNVWLNYKLENNELSKNQIKELPCYFTERTNWFKKGFTFLKAKLFNKKYKGSF